MGGITIGDLVKMKEEKRKLEMDKIEKLKDDRGYVDVSKLVAQIDDEERKKELQKQESEGMMGDDIEVL